MLEKLKEMSEAFLYPAKVPNERLLIEVWIAFIQQSLEMRNYAINYLGKELYDYVLKEAKERGIL